MGLGFGIREIIQRKKVHRKRAKGFVLGFFVGTQIGSQIMVSTPPARRSPYISIPISLQTSNPTRKLLPRFLLNFLQRIIITLYITQVSKNNSLQPKVS